MCQPAQPKRVDRVVALKSVQLSEPSIRSPVLSKGANPRDIHWVSTGAIVMSERNGS
jgi:hypothetical protein